jgi:hypothetical protein
MVQPEFVTACHAAELRNVSPPTVIAQIKKGIVPGKKFGNSWMIRFKDVGKILKRANGRPKLAKGSK